MLDYLSLQGSSENPTFITILFTVLLSFLLSSLIAYTYQKTSRSVTTAVEFVQSLILVSIVAATVMQAIGDSLARGLGMLGALAIIRFRTNVKSPRNMAFTFAALAAGIACGVYGFVIGITGTLGFCASAFILRFSPLSKSSNIIGTLKFDLPILSKEWKEVEMVLKEFCRNHVRVRYQISEPKVKEEKGKPCGKILSLEYQLKLKSGVEGSTLYTALSELKTLQGFKIDFQNQPEMV